MTTKDLKVGMKVWIREDLKTCEVYGGCYFAAEMQILTGQQTIEDFNKSSHNFRLKGDGCWWFAPEMIDWEKTEKINKKEPRLTYDGTTLEGEIDGQEIKVVRSYKDKEDLEKAVMMALLKSLGVTYVDVKDLKNKVKTPWRPQEEEKYYFVTSCGTVDYTYNYNSRVDKELFDFGNCFETEEEAEKKVVEISKIFKK